MTTHLEHCFTEKGRQEKEDKGYAICFKALLNAEIRF